MPIYQFTYHRLAQTSYFNSALELAVSDMAVVALEQGQVLARVVSGPHDTCEEVEAGVVLRKATEEDLAQAEENKIFGRQAGEFWKSRVAARNLEMKLVEVEVYFDRSKLIFYFTAQSRIDFRELVKDIVHAYRLRIEFRQIGVRHETQMIGAVGNCGMVCCCRRYLHQFAPVTIRMAKEQDLFLNPSKVSGICGRLLCCLAYEQENYENFHNTSPRPGKRYMTDRGQFKVIRTNMFQNSVTCLVDGCEEVRFSLEEWNAMNPVRVESGSREAGEQYQSPLQCYHDESDGDFPEDDQPEHRKGRAATARRPQKQTFVTGRVSYRQQGRGQESWKKSAGLVPSRTGMLHSQHADKGHEAAPARTHDRAHDQHDLLHGRTHEHAAGHGHDEHAPHDSQGHSHETGARAAGQAARHAASHESGHAHGHKPAARAAGQQPLPAAGHAQPDQAAQQVQPGQDLLAAAGEAGTAQQPAQQTHAAAQGPAESSHSPAVPAAQAAGTAAAEKDTSPDAEGAGDAAQQGTVPAQTLAEETCVHEPAEDGSAAPEGETSAAQGGARPGSRDREAERRTAAAARTQGARRGRKGHQDRARDGADARQQSRQPAQTGQEGPAARSVQGARGQQLRDQASEDGQRVQGQQPEGREGGRPGAGAGPRGRKARREKRHGQRAKRDARSQAGKKN